MIPVHFRRSIAGLPIAVALLAAGLLAAAQQQPQQVPGAFRSRVTMVPVDVRVLDKNGRPVTDLRRDEFVILEDRVRQEITQFLTQELTASVPADDAPPELRKAPGPGVSAQSKRIFLFVLGRGRLQHPGGNVDAMIDFVRKRLLPQDQVAILAYNRASDFTTNHEKVAQLIERFKTRHERINTDLAHHFSGLQAIYGSLDIPKNLQDAIDDVFRLEGAPGFRTLTGEITDRASIAKDNRSAIDVLQRGEAAAAKKAGGGTTMDVMAESEAELVGMDMSLDEFAFVRLRSMQDLTSIYTGIEYLRFLEGEKHLVYVSEQGLSLPRLENDKSVAALANDARVVIDPIYTGGVAGAPPPTSRGWSAVPTSGMVFGQTFAVSTNRLIADLTGGQATAFRSAAQALDRIDRATRFSYLLGYQPANPDWNGAYRRIDVKVTRPGVTVHFRHGYYARQQLVPFDRQQFLIYSRIVAAGNHPQQIRDIGVTVEATLEKPEASRAKRDEAAKAGLMLVRGSVSSARMVMTHKGDKRVVAIEIAVFCGNNRGEVVGQAWNRIDLEMTPEVYELFMKKGISYNTRIPISEPVNAVKVVAYNPEADLVGSAITRVK